MEHSQRLTDYLVSKYTSRQEHRRHAGGDGRRHDAAELWAAATQHPFLVKAGEGVLADSTLARWFAQDIHYTRAYIQFVGGLLSRLRLPTSISISSGVGAAGAAKHEKNIYHRAFDVLVTALTGIQREMQFFEDTIRKYGLEAATFEDEHAQHMQPHTKAYVDLLQSAGHGSASLLEGLTVLWGTEYAYLQAWSFAKTQQALDWTGPEQKTACQNARGALHEMLIPNWSSPEFAQFVEECRAVLDDFARVEHVELPSSSSSSSPLSESTSASARLKQVQEWFDQVIWLEGRFWPSVD